MYPRLRPDVLFLRVGGGIRVESDSHAVTLRGSDVPSLAFALLPLLDGRHADGTIAARFEPAVRPRVARMMALLAAEGMVIDGGSGGSDGSDESDASHWSDRSDGGDRSDASERPAAMPRSVRERFRASIEFLRHTGGDPLAGFQRFRASRVIVAGAGVSFRTCAESLARHGLASLTLLPAGNSPGNAAQDAEEVRQVRLAIDALPLGNLRPEEITVEPNAIAAETRFEAHINARATPTAAAESISSPRRPGRSNAHFDAVVACTDAPDLALLRALNRQCARASIAFLPAFGLANRIFLGPLMPPAAAGCWTCGLLRIVRDLVEPARCAEVLRDLQAHPEARGAAFAADAALAARLGRDAALEIFKMLGGARRSLVSDTILAQHQETNGGAGIRAMLTPAVLGACLGHCRLVSDDAFPDPVYDMEPIDDIDTSMNETSINETSIRDTDLQAHNVKDTVRC
jgi:hypothetical protein